MFDYKNLQKVFIVYLSNIIMSDGKISMPGGMGGLMRYDEEYASRFMLGPVQVFIFVVLVALGVLAAKIFFPIG